MGTKWITLTACILLLAAPASAQTQDDFFDDSILHEIRLDVRASDWQRLKDRFLENTYYTADMHWRFNGKYIDVPQVGIRSRGVGSRSPIKPGLHLDFTKKVSAQRFLGLTEV